jgi:methyl-accepting chemotaxis protein
MATARTSKAIATTGDGANARRSRTNGSGQAGTKRAATKRPASRPNGSRSDAEALGALLGALESAGEGDFTIRLQADAEGTMGEMARAFNRLAERSGAQADEIVRVGRIIGREGRMEERARLDGASGAWAESVHALNALIDDLARPTTEVARVIVAVAEGDLSQKMASPSRASSCASARP